MNVHTAGSGVVATDNCRRLLSLKEVVTLADVSERRIRKDIETGLLTAPNVLRLADARLCFDWTAVFRFAAVYSNAYLTAKLRRIALDQIRVRCDAPHKADIAVIVRQFRDSSIHLNMHCRPLAVDRYLMLDLPAVCAAVEPKVSLYIRGLDRIEERPDILGGNAVFRGTRLSVAHVGKMVENGESVANIIEDYPYLTADDIAFAVIYSRAHPPVGRPSITEDPPDDVEACAR
jgi:uncharacterized protein (DUF433 family)